MKHFTRREFACKGQHCCGGDNLMQDDFLSALDGLREVYGKPLVVLSGYRCPVHNQAVSTTGPDGPHTTGRAADLKVDRANAVTLLLLALKTPLFRGFGIQQKGAVRFLHLDAVPRAERAIWSY